MTCFEEFPVSTVVYYLSVAGGLTALGIVAAAHFGTGLLVAYLVLLAVALAGTLSSVCTRCAGYFGRRCGLGLGKAVPLLFRQRPAEEFLRTPAQFVILALLVAGLVWPIVGGAILMARGFSIGRLALPAAAVILLLAFAVPHPRIVCRHCRQGESGACPIGRKAHRADAWQE